VPDANIIETTPPGVNKAVIEGCEREDPVAMARAATLDELNRLQVAEEVIEKRHARKRRTARLFTVSQAMVGYVALAGFFANAYQNRLNKAQADVRAEIEKERWSKEFERAQDADTYRAFFETAALATDRANADKRLVGYALLKEFMTKNKYDQKATFMLEESLALELRDEAGPGLDEQHRAAVTSILTSLSQATSCQALGRAARTISKLAVKHKKEHDVAESKEVLDLYILRILGRAAHICTPKDFLDVRHPVRELMLHNPEISGLKPRATAVDADRQIAQILRETCQAEIEGGVTDCAAVPAAWKAMCTARDQLKPKLTDGSGLCEETLAR
jgi:hypothetical protein